MTVLRLFDLGIAAPLSKGVVERAMNWGTSLATDETAYKNTGVNFYGK